MQARKGKRGCSAAQVFFKSLLHLIQEPTSQRMPSSSKPVSPNSVRSQFGLHTACTLPLQPQTNAVNCPPPASFAICYSTFCDQQVLGFSFLPEDCCSRNAYCCWQWRFLPPQPPANWHWDDLVRFRRRLQWLWPPGRRPHCLHLSHCVCVSVLRALPQPQALQHSRR